MITLEDQLKIDEGIRNKPYRCTAGDWTIGVGWNISQRGLPNYAADELLTDGVISGDSIEIMLTESANEAANDVIKFCRYNPPVDIVRFNALANMAFNLGYERLSGFKRMRAAVLRLDWDRAAFEAQDSLWYTQVGNRAVRIVRELRDGEKTDV